MFKVEELLLECSAVVQWVSVVAWGGGGGLCSALLRRRCHFCIMWCREVADKIPGCRSAVSWGRFFMNADFWSLHNTITLTDLVTHSLTPEARPENADATMLSLLSSYWLLVSTHSTVQLQQTPLKLSHSKWEVFGFYLFFGASL